MTADEFTRSFRGAAAFLHRRPDALSLFEISLPAFWRSFAALLFTAPAYVVELALQRRQLGLGSVEGGLVLDDPGLAALVLTGHLLGFLALPAAMVVVARRFGLGGRYVPFVIVTNWLFVFASFALVTPGALLVLGFETPALAALFTAAFLLIALFVHWHATRVTLHSGASAAAAVTLLGLGLWLGVGALVQALV